MNVPVSKQLTDISGKPMSIPDETGHVVDVTLGGALIKALVSNVSGDSKVAAEDRFKRYKLAQRIQAAVDNCEDCQMTAEEVVLCKQLTALAYTAPGLMGPIWELLEPAN